MCLSRRITPEPAQIIEDIHEAGGIAVLAHPGQTDSFELLDELIPLGLDGVEAWHPENSEEQTAALLDKAKSAGILVTGGTEFRGMYSKKPLSVGAYSAPRSGGQGAAYIQIKAQKKESKAGRKVNHENERRRCKDLSPKKER